MIKLTFEGIHYTREASSLLPQVAGIPGVTSVTIENDFISYGGPGGFVQHKLTGYQRLLVICADDQADAVKAKVLAIPGFSAESVL